MNPQQTIRAIAKAIHALEDSRKPTANQCSSCGIEDELSIEVTWLDYVAVFCEDCTTGFFPDSAHLMEGDE